MKKLFESFLIFCLLNSICLSSMSITMPEKQNDGFISASINTSKTKKDPMLINIQTFKDIDEDSYNEKLESDNLEKQKQAEKLSEDNEKLYYIFEKIIRANKLQYQIWRIGLAINTEELNAESGCANLIRINSSIYDSLYQNDDALAFIIAHELAHLLLSHGQISAENYHKVEEMKQTINAYNSQLGIGGSGYYTNIGNSIENVTNTILIASYNAEVNKFYKKARQLEDEADIEAISLMARAGYNPNKAADTFNLLARVPNVYTKKSTHPDIKSRIQNVQNEIRVLDLSELKKEGRINIYNSDVLQIKKSSDKTTFVVLPTDNFCEQYVQESKEKKYIKKAYTSYKMNDFENARNYFLHAYKINPKNYVTPLYIAYCYENLYLKTHNRKELELAKKYINEAKKLNKYDSHVLEEEQSIKNLLGD